jgi:hypothetical protein
LLTRANRITDDKVAQEKKKKKEFHHGGVMA